MAWRFSFICRERACPFSFIQNDPSPQPSPARGEGDIFLVFFPNCRDALYGRLKVTISNSLPFEGCHEMAWRFSFFCRDRACPVSLIQNDPSPQPSPARGEGDDFDFFPNRRDALYGRLYITISNSPPHRMVAI